jgi:hypothetical protein
MTEQPRGDALREAVLSALRELLPDVVGPSTGNDHSNGNGHTDGQSNGNGHAATGQALSSDMAAGHGPESAASVGQDPIPLVPAPPVAAVLRPSTWDGPAVPGELIGLSQTPYAQEAGETQAASVPLSEPIVDARHPNHGVAAREGRPLPPDTIVEAVKLDSDEELQLFVRSLVTRLESPRDRLAIKAGRLRFRLQRSPAAMAGAAGPQASTAVRVPKGAVTERHVREAHADGTRLVLARAAVLTPLAREAARTLGVQIERESQC